MNNLELKKFMKKNDIDEDDVAKIVNKTKKTVQNWLNNVRNMPENSEFKLLMWEKGEQPTSDRSIPLFDETYASAGGDGYVALTDRVGQSSMIDIGDTLRDSVFAIRIYGNSMMPNYPSGCIVGVRNTTSNVIASGEVYVIEFDNERYIKRLFDNGDTIECYSDNQNVFESGERKGKPFYPSMYLPKSEDVRLYRVVGMIKRNLI